MHNDTKVILFLIKFIFCSIKFSFCLVNSVKTALNLNIISFREYFTTVLIFFVVYFCLRERLQSNFIRRHLMKNIDMRLPCKHLIKKPITRHY